MAAALLDSRAPGLSSGVRGRVLREAGGNPLALTELPVALESDQGTAAPALPQRLPLTTRLEQAFAERARGLPAAARAVLLVAAVDDEGSLGEVLGAAAYVISCQAPPDRRRILSGPVSLLLHGRPAKGKDAVDG